MAETLTAGEALIALRATSDKLSADMAAASSKITSELQKIEKSAASIDFGKVFEGGLKAAAAFAGGVAAVGTAATALALQSVKTGDEINRMSQAFGISAEELSGLKMAAEDVDVSFSQVQVGLKTLANQAADAAAGNEAAARTFEALGIAVTDANGNLRPTGEILADVADRMAAMQDGAGKTAIATQLLGRSGQDLIPVLNGGSAALRQAAEEAKGLGVAFDSEAAAAAAALDDQLDKLGHQIGGVANEIGQSLMPIVSQVVGEVSGWIEQNRTLLSQSVEQWVSGVKVAIDALLPPLAAAARGFKELAESMFGSGLSSLSELEAEEARLIARTNELKGAIDSTTVVNQYNAEMVAHLKDEYANLSAQLSGVQNRIASAKGETVAGAKAFDQLAGKTDKAAGSADDAAKNFGKVPPPIIKTGDAAKKAAKEFAELANKLADTSAASADYAIEQIDLAGETGDLTAIESAHADAIVAVEKAYQDGLAAIEANKRAGEEQKLLDAELVKLEQDKETALRKVAKTTAAATAVTKQYAIELEQVTLDQLALEADQAAREMQKLVRAGAANIVIQQAAAKAAEKEKAVRDQQVKIIRMQEGAQKDANKQTIISAGATNAAAKAADQYSQRIEDLNDQLRQAKLEDPLGKLDRKLGESADDITLKLDELLHGDKGFGQFVEDLKETLLGSNGPGAIIDAMGAAAEHGLRDLLKETVNFGTDIVKSLVNDVTEPITNGLQHLEEEIVKGIENLAEDAWDAITDLFGGGQSREQQLAEQLGKSIGASFTNDAVRKAVIAGAEAIGDYAGESLVHAMAKMPVSELHKGIHDVVTEAFAGESAAVQTEIQQLAQAAGTAVSASLGYVGGEAIAFSQAWAASWIRAQVQAGKSTEQIIKSLEAMGKSLGTSGGIFAALDELNAKIIETGKSGEVFKDLGAIIKDWTGKKTDVQSFSDVLAAFGGDAVLTLNAIKKALEDNGIAVEQFGGDLGDVVLAFTGAGDAIKAATEDYRDFGNEADGTAQILREQVLSSLDDVIATAHDFPVEGVQAFRSAVALIPPEMLKSSEFTKKLKDDFARMAAESHMSVQELVDSIDPPLPAAMRNAILSAHDLGVAIGALAGAPLSSLKEVTDRMKQFAGDMYTYAEEGGKQVKRLTAFGEQLVGDTVSAINGMWDTIAKDGQASQDEIYEVFAQIAQIPEETLGDPAVQSAVQGLLAKIGEQTGDAFIIGLSALPEVTKEQLDQALGIYEEWKRDVEDNPPEVAPEVQPPQNPDGTPADPNAPTGPDTTPANTAPPPQPIPPETLKSWEEINGAAIDYAKAVTEGRDAVLALSADTVTSAAAILAAIKPIYGTPEDDGSFSSIERIAHDIAKFLPEVLTPAFKDFGIEASHAVSSVYEAAVNAKSAMDSLAGTYEVVVKYVTEGSPGGPPSGGACNCGPGGATGGWVPGSVGEPFPMVAHGGEFILPADIAQRVIGGGAMPSNATTSFGAPSATQSAPADPDYALIPVRKRDLIEGAVLEVARATQTGRAHVEGRQIHVSPTYGRRR